MSISSGQVPDVGVSCFEEIVRFPDLPALSLFASPFL